MVGPRQTDWLERLEDAHENLRAALTWSSTNARDVEAGLRLAAALWRFWDMRGHLSEGCDHLRNILNRTGTDGFPRAQARALAVLGYLATIRGRRDEAQVALEEAKRLWREIGDQAGLAVTLFYAGLFKAWSQSEIEPAETLLIDSLRLRGAIRTQVDGLHRPDPAWRSGAVARRWCASRRAAP